VDSGPCHVVGEEDEGDEGSSEDVVIDAATRKKGGLFRPNGVLEAMRKTFGKHFSKDAVGGVQEGDGAVGSG
jgi:hypothetical protein